MKQTSQSHEKRLLFQFFFFAIAPALGIIAIFLFFRRHSETLVGWQVFLIYVLVSIIIALILGVVVTSINHFRRATHRDNRKIFQLGRMAVLVASFSAVAVTFPFAFAIVFMDLQRQGGQCIEDFSNNWDALYFSYTTITTLGYGDLRPLGFCRIVTSIEALFGLTAFGLFTATLFSIFNTKE